MSKFLKIIIPLILVLAILGCMIWYLFIYDRDFTRDMLLSFARISESQGNHNAASWLYNQAYLHMSDNDSVACELAEQYKANGNYTKAEFTLTNAIADGGGIDLYIALCKTYVEQDKLLDAVNMLNGVQNPEVKEQLDAIRPAAPVALPEPGFYNQYISLSLQSDDWRIYADTTGVYPSVHKSLYTNPIPLAEGENKVYAVAIGENGLVSPLAIYVYTIGGIIEQMNFADPAIEASVREKLSVSADAKLHTNDLWTIKDFTVPANAEVYTDLKHMTFLETLTIEEGISEEIKNISSLSNITTLTIQDTTISQDVLQIITGLPALKELTLSNCSLSNITPLEKAVLLTHLDLNNNAVRDLSPLATLTELKTLNLSHNAITSLAGISGNIGITNLDISFNSVESLSPLAALTALTELNANNNSIVELGDISQLQALSKLSLNNNKLTNVNTVAACLGIVELNISTNNLTDIASLAQLSKLMYLDFSYNSVVEIPEFPKDCALVTINGANNQIAKLDNLGGLDNLNNVHMDYNTEIATVEPLKTCHRLIEVNVYATKVTDVTPLTNQSVIVNYNPVKTAN